MEWLKKTCFLTWRKNHRKIIYCCLLRFVVSSLESSRLGITDIFLQREQSRFGFVVFLSLFGTLLTFIESMEAMYKYIMTFMLLMMSFIMVQAFNESPAVFQMVYFTLAVSLIYLSERLVVILGGVAVVLTFILCSYWPEQFLLIQLHLKLQTSQLVSDRNNRYVGRHENWF